MIISQISVKTYKDEMKIESVAGARTATSDPPRATAYYYGDLERLKRKPSPPSGGQDGDQLETQDGGAPMPTDDARQNPDELSEYVESNEVVNDGAVREVPPLRDRRQWSLPEYSIPENPQKVREETYSTAGTFPMPEPKEKEPLLAELEIVGRVPLTQLDSASGVRRSRSWYLCCPNMGEEEVSRESSWRYSSLRPVTAPPAPGQNGIVLPVSSASVSGGEDSTEVSGEALRAVRLERDSLARALGAERARAAAAARAHDARLAELHGVIAELVRRRQRDERAPPIPEEEFSEECESTTQAAGELDQDGDCSRTDQNELSSMLSSGLGTPQPSRPDLSSLPDDTSDASAGDYDRCRESTVGVRKGASSPVASDRDSELCLTTARWCVSARARCPAALCVQPAGTSSLGLATLEAAASTTPPPPRPHTDGEHERSRGRAKLASRVRLKRAADVVPAAGDHETWCVRAAERLARELCAQADLREALVVATNEEACASERLCAARCARLAAECRVLELALERAREAARRLGAAGAQHESRVVALCMALGAADRALEVYDVLLALAETSHPDADPNQRSAAELVARRLLAQVGRLQTSTLGEPLLSPGPWLHHDRACAEPAAVGDSWGAAEESSLRAHAARLKAETVTLRDLSHQPQLFSSYDAASDDEAENVRGARLAEMEAAVNMQEILAAREARLVREQAGKVREREREKDRERQSVCGRRHWLDAAASETDL